MRVFLPSPMDTLAACSNMAALSRWCCSHRLNDPGITTTCSTQCSTAHVPLPGCRADIPRSQSVSSTEILRTIRLVLQIGPDAPAQVQHPRQELLVQQLMVKILSHQVSDSFQFQSEDANFISQFTSRFP